MRPNQRNGLTILLAVLVGVLAVLTLKLNPVARLVPIYVVFPTLGLLLLTLISEFAPGGLGAMLGVSGGTEPPLQRTTYVEVRALASILSLPVLIYLVGFVLGVFLYVYLYIRHRGEWGWLRALLASASIAVVVSGMSYIVLGDRVLRGWIWS